MMQSTIILFLCVILSSRIGSSICQCLSENKKDANETDMGSAVRLLIDGNLNFSLDLLRTLELETRSNKNKEGIFFSPFSIWSALMVTYMGANGRTESQLKKVLGIQDNIDKEILWDAYRNILNWNSYRQINPQKESYKVANKLYFQENTLIKECLKELMNSEIDFADFANNPEAAALKINEWVSKETKGKIQDLISPGSLDAMTKMIIANAVYFKENWEIKFDPARTKRRRFTLPSRRDIYVNMMSVKGSFLYGISEELQCTGLELPYDGNDLSMVILLPKNRYYGISRLAYRLTSEKLQNFLDEMYPRVVRVLLPKFKLEDQFELSPTLGKMGLRNLFDLSGFSNETGLRVSAIHHKSFVDVNEEGTEAAAATAVISSRSARPLQPASFYADYPFIFFIRDNVANVILFMGTVQKPQEHKKN